MPERLALAVMARAPSDDSGKTRLRQTCGAERAAALRRAILLDTLESIRAVRSVDRIVLFAPETARPEFEALVDDSEGLLGQRGSGLGERMEHGFSDLLGRDYTGVVMVGSDLPTLPAAYVDQGIDVLRRQDDPLVLGPSEDGGYYLIGLRRCHPELFHGIPWSTSSVLARTRALAAGLGMAVTTLPSWYDLDSADDLDRVIRTVDAGGSARARHVRAWAAAPQGTREVLD